MMGHKYKDVSVLFKINIPTKFLNKNLYLGLTIIIAKLFGAIKIIGIFVAKLQIGIFVMAQYSAVN